MKSLDYTGLDAKKVEKVVKELSQLLADFQVYYANLRGFHWNVKGDKFYQLHEYYEGQWYCPKKCVTIISHIFHFVQNYLLSFQHLH